jgi:uncharacterized glyoxalase superfamily protein PhnB
MKGPDMEVQPINPAVSPSLCYNDAKAAIRWLVDVLGFRVSSIYEEPDGHVHFSQLVWDTGAVQVSSRSKKPRLPETGRFSIVLTAADAKAVDQIYARAQAAGAKILLPIEDTFYGSHGFSLSDPEGNLWHLGTPWLGREAGDHSSQVQKAGK